MIADEICIDAKPNGLGDLMHDGQAETNVPSTDSAIPSSSPIRGRIGEMIMIWLLAAKTRSQRAKTMTPGEGLSRLKRHHPHRLSLWNTVAERWSVHIMTS